MSQKTEAWLRELNEAALGNQDAGSHNLPSDFCIMSVKFLKYLSSTFQRLHSRGQRGRRRSGAGRVAEGSEAGGGAHQAGQRPKAGHPEGDAEGGSQERVSSPWAVFG